MFDRVEIIVRAGNGGDGAASFRREKFVPLGGPDGGDGGRGGSVIIRADDDVSNLNYFRQHRAYSADSGKNGSSQRKSGRSGADLILKVPPGTIVSEKLEEGDDIVLADLREKGQEVVAAAGGGGGLGNSHFASSINQAPVLAQKGEEGEQKNVILELKLIADAGIVGYPNVGKSSLVAAASAAHPKIADYPFTTLEPVLGTVMVGHQTFVLAEIPGLIAEASLGKGLGHDFLRHVVRTRLLVHLLNGDSPSPVDDMIQVNNELSVFDSALGKKPQIVAVNKIDLPQVREQMPEIRKVFKGIGIKVHFISAFTGEGVPELMAEVLKELERITPQEEEPATEESFAVFHPQPRGDTRITRDGDVFVIENKSLERIIEGTDATKTEAKRQLIGLLNRPHTRKALERAGAKTGDRVRCGSFEWRW
ncbi:MAG: GTPase ObgE [Dehalococcoidales bacterium]|jgi:GTP-binding protein|nr:GTPase ObgE [Dehalococcoidales bacterium]MDD3994213.1 GTPase ObgE [Dehalococcoidales bacterium]NLT27582.1 GTPase ObgE [Dehalococcoidales bacterium]